MQQYVLENLLQNYTIFCKKVEDTSDEKKKIVTFWIRGTKTELKQAAHGTVSFLDRSETKSKEDETVFTVVVSTN